MASTPDVVKDGPHLEGVADLMAKLRALQLLDDGKALRAGARAASKVVVDAATARAPVGKVAHKTYKGRMVLPGFTKRSVRFVTQISGDKQKVSASVGVRAEAFYSLSFVEVGTSKMPARPWLRPAFESTLQQQTDAMADALRKFIERTIKKRAKFMAGV